MDLGPSPHFQTNQHILVDTGGDVWKQDQGSRKSRGGGVGVRLDNSADSNSLSPIDPIAIWQPFDCYPENRENLQLKSCDFRCFQLRNDRSNAAVGSNFAEAKLDFSALEGEGDKTLLEEEEEDAAWWSNEGIWWGYCRNGYMI